MTSFQVITEAFVNVMITTNVGDVGTNVGARCQTMAMLLPKQLGLAHAERPPLLARSSMYPRWQSTAQGDSPGAVGSEIPSAVGGL